MAEESQFYYLTPKGRLTSLNNKSFLIKWNKTYYVTIEESGNENQCLSVSVEKFADNESEPPTSNKFEKVKSILEDVFNDNYYYGLRCISATKITNGEYYIVEHSKNYLEIKCYPKEEKNSQSVIISFLDSIEDLSITIDTSQRFKGRLNARNHGTAIPFRKFKQFLNLTLKFFSDQNSYNIYLDTYLKNFKNLIQGKEPVGGFDISSEKAFKNIIEQLETNIATIEKKLIEKDNLSKNERAILRAEMKALKYAIKTILLYQ
jgi:hypothetical protein